MVDRNVIFYLKSTGLIFNVTMLQRVFLLIEDRTYPFVIQITKISDRALFSEILLILSENVVFICKAGFIRPLKQELVRLNETAV